jgi:hypothetical protein
MRGLLCRSAVVVAVLIGIVQPVSAWNRAGHMLSGAIAYDTLKKDNPKKLEKVIAILKTHPHYATMWQKQLERVDEQDRDQYLFMLAARWADDIRDDADYNQPTWHYIDFPFIPPGQPPEVKSADPPEPNIQTAFRQNVDTFQKGKDDKERAVALTWIFHLMGDCHQPLHSTAVFTTDFLPPKGDAGGTKGFIRAEADKDPINLHKYWDDLVIGSERITDVRNRGIEIRHDFPREQLDKTPKTVTPNDFPKWIQESFEVAKKDVYRQGKVLGSVTRDKAPVLPDDYAKVNQPVAQKRVALAGYRLADLLQKLVQ